MEAVKVPAIDQQRTYELVILMTDFMVAEYNASVHEWSKFCELFDLDLLLWTGKTYPIYDIHRENCDTVNHMLTLRSQLRGS